jgi:phosphoenolpyruvate synthase/pyruvate phosphate dikinase
MNTFKSPELENFKPEDYHFFGFWKNNLFGTSFWQNCFSSGIIKDFGLEAKTLGTMDLNGGNFLIKKSVSDYLGNQIKKEIDKKNSDFFDNMIKVADQTFGKGVEVGNSLRFAEPTIDNFIKFEEIAKKINFIWAFSAVCLLTVIEKSLLDALTKDSFPAEHIMDIIPRVITPLTNRQKELTELKNKIKGKTFQDIMQDPILSAEFKKHIDKYAWVEIANFIGEPFTQKRLYEEIKHLKGVEENKKYIPEKPLSEELLFNIRCMHTFGYIKQAGAEYFSILTERVMPFLDKIANKIGLVYSEFIYLNPEEVKDALINKISTLDLKRRIKPRKKHRRWLYLSRDNGEVIFLENEHDIDILTEMLIPKINEKGSELKGFAANSGEYTGTAKIVLNTDDFHKMNSGDVLVSTMTTPDFVVLMQKSGAIVTDIGGMLSHASIVSRELKKPCIIGTRFATQTINDGDLVEVDANKGIVKILKRAENASFK